MYYSLVKGEEGVQQEDAKMFEQMGIVQRVWLSCKILLMAVLGSVLGLTMVCVKWYIGMDR